MLNVLDPDSQAFASRPDTLIEKQAGKIPECVMLVGACQIGSDLLACEHQFIPRVAVGRDFNVDERIVFEPSVIKGEACTLTPGKNILSEGDLKPASLAPPSQVVEHVASLPA